MRDHLKSMKHYWDEATFIPDVADTDAAWTVASRLRQLREDEFVGGFVWREFESFVSAEVRTWWISGRCVLIGPHPDSPLELPQERIDPSWLSPMMAELGLPFVTADLALRCDGVWRVVEVGDGQVSDRPASVEPEEIIAALVEGLG